MSAGGSGVGTDSLPSLRGELGSADGTGPSRLLDLIGIELLEYAQGRGPSPVVADRYELLEILGAGGFGVVCRARNVKLDRLVALKLIAGSDSEASVSAVLREARALARVQNPAVVEVFSADAGRLRTRFDELAVGYVEMRLEQGRSLRRYVADRPRGDAYLRIMIAVVRAMAAAHGGGVLHRDLKPENIIVREDGTPVVIDFGLALGSESAAADQPSSAWQGSRDAIGSRLTTTGFLRGTPAYMAPEAMTGRVGPRGDQYALAVAIREGLTGHNPLVGDVAVHRPGEGVRGGAWWFGRLRRVLDRAMSSAPDDRYDDLDSFARALERAVVGVRRRRALAGASLAGGAVIAGMLGFSLTLGDDLSWTSGWRVPARGSPAAAAAATETEVGGIPHESNPPDDAVVEAPPDSDSPESVDEVAVAASPSERAAPGATGAGETSTEGGGAPFTPSKCADLASWTGTWKVAGAVTWSEFASHYEDFPFDFELELAAGGSCAAWISVRVLPDENMTCPEAATTWAKTSARVLEVSDGSLLVEGKIDMLGRNGATYRSKGSARCGATSFERVRWALNLRAEHEGELIVGSVEIANLYGTPTRRAKVLGRREKKPEVDEARVMRVSCPVTCTLEALGTSARERCVLGGCPAGGSSTPEGLGAPSFDAPVPLQAKAQINRLRKGEQMLSVGSDCSRDIASRAGRWRIWKAGAIAGAQPLVVSLRQDGCALRGHVDGAAPPAERAITGMLTKQGSWALWGPGLQVPLVLAGGGLRGPAFGATAQDEPRALRAERI